MGADWTSSDGTQRLLCGDVLERMAGLEAESVDCVVTSPPYWGLRSYGQDAAWGLEEDWREWLRRMLAFGAEVKRVLKPSGTFWLVLGDAYAGSQPKDENAQGTGNKQLTNPGSVVLKGFKGDGFMRPKDLMLLPSRVAIAYHDELGFWVRNDIVWRKSNPMPHSVKDRLSNAWEHVFLFTKSPRYYFSLDAVRRPHAEESIARVGRDERLMERTGRRRSEESKYWDIPGGEDGPEAERQFGKLAAEAAVISPNGANPRDVLEGPTAQAAFAHFAVFPEYLPEFCLKAGAVPGGLILDPFVGSGTTLAVAARLGLRGIGIDVSAAYLEMAKKRIERAILERDRGVEAAKQIEQGQGLLL